MKVKHIVSVLILGCMLILMGALFKILHWAYAPELLTVGTYVVVFSLLLAIVKLIVNKDPSSFLNK